MTNRLRAFLAAFVLMLAVGALSACGLTDKVAQPFNDAPVQQAQDVRGPMKIVPMGDGFNNVGYRCVGAGHSGFAVTFHGDSPYGSATHFVDPALCP